MTNVRPSISSTIAVTDAAGGMFRRSGLRHLGGTGKLKVDGTNVQPGPWKLTVESAFKNSAGAEGGQVFYDIGLYPPGSDDATLAGIVAAGTGVSASFPGGGNWWTTATEGAGAGVLDGCAYYWGNAVGFENDVGQWIGPRNKVWWTGLPFPLSRSAVEATQGAAPDGIRTNQPLGYGPGWASGDDPLADFDNPIVCVTFRSAQAHFTDERWEPPLEPPIPAMPINRSRNHGGATVTLHNNLVAMTYLTTGWVVSDRRLYPAGPVGQHIIDNKIVAWGGMTFNNIGAYCWVDISQPPLAVTTLYAGAAESGLVAVG